MSIAATILAASIGAQPIVVERADCWAVGWKDVEGTIHVVSSDRHDHASFVEATRTAWSGLLWFPWLSPRTRPRTTPMQDCFQQARETCRAQGEKVCYVFWIPGYGEEGACIVGCSVNGICGEPPPIPPVPAGIAPETELIIASLVQEASFALINEG